MLSKTFVPPGFRFHPTDVELVLYYLQRKAMGKPFRFEAISEVELYKYPPWELPEKSQLRTKDLEWYFFCPRDKKYPNGSRTNRATDIGYWKATGKDRSVIHNSRTVGMIKTLIFHVGKPPKGKRTDWVMYEYRLENKELVDTGYAQDSYVLCKIYKKSGRGPKIGEQYGAPYTEEEWEEDTAAESSLHRPFVSCLSSEPSNNETPSLGLGTEPLITSSVVQVPSDGDHGISLAELEKLLNSSPPTENGNIQMFDSANHGMIINEAPTLEPEELYNDLENISSQEMTLNNINQAEYIPCEIALQRSLSELNDDQFVQLSDFGWLENGNASEPIMPYDPFSLPTYVQWPNSQNLDYILSPNPYFNALHNPDDAGPDITNAQLSLYMQFGDFDESAPHHNFPVSETQHNLLQEHHPADTIGHSG